MKAARPNSVFARRLHVTAVEVSPGHPVAVGRSRKIRTVDFKAGELFVLVPVYIEDGNWTIEFRRRIHERRCDGNDSADFL